MSTEFHIHNYSLGDTSANFPSLHVLGTMQQTLYVLLHCRCVASYLLCYLLTVIDCGEPPLYPNAVVVDTGGPSTTFGSEVTYQCNEGYRFENRSGIAANSTCRGSGNWSTPPICQGMLTKWFYFW